jgi:hypothetical protein
LDRSILFVSLFEYKTLGAYLINGGHQVVLDTGQAVKNNRSLLDGRWDKRMYLWPESSINKVETVKALAGSAVGGLGLGSIPIFLYLLRCS